ncbi:MAG: response regulator [Verrucomicrobiae bacterium]|nr:response regulator [Verrucomicrobiae bacterium]
MKKRILLVDDELDFSALLQFRLREWGYDTIVATSGMEGMRKSAEQQPDLILTDLVLPDLDGLTLCEILRRQGATRGTPVFMITATANYATRYSAHAAGVREFFAKPLDFERLRQGLEVAFATPAMSARQWSSRNEPQEGLAGWLGRAVVLRRALGGARADGLDGSDLSCGPVVRRDRHTTEA